MASRRESSVGGRRDGKKSAEPVRLPRLTKAQSAPDLRRNRAEPSQPSKAAQQGAQSQPAARQAGRQGRDSQPALLSYQVKTQVLEALSDPHIRKVSRDLYNKYIPHDHGQLSLNELKRALRALTQKLKMPDIPNEVAESMLKKFDADGDGNLTPDDFYEIFVASLRRVAFDQASLFGRNVFITQQSGKVWDHYKHMKKLGSGSFATTYLCKHRTTGDERVIKAVEKSKMQLPIEDIEKEIMIMRQIDHPHVVRLFEWYEGSSTVYLVIDSLTGGTLREVVLNNYYQQGAGLKEAWIQKVMHQVVEAMAYCHSLRLIHKDLKDENIMLLKKDRNYEKPFAVIIDLGVAEMFTVSDPKGNIIAGTPATMAPEVWKGNFGPKCDVWSLGCVLFELLAGSMPYMAMTLDPNEWARKYQKGPDWRLVRTSPQGKDLCEKMLTVAESSRPTMRQCLDQEWFSCHGQTLQKVVNPTQFAELQKFGQLTALSRSLLLELAGRLPMERAEKIVQVFQEFDVNRDGSISKEELMKGFRKLGMTQTDFFESTFKALDVDENGTLSFSEFAAGVLLMFKDLLEGRFRALFRRYDKDCDGLMTKDDVEAFLSVARKIAKKDACSAHKDVLASLFPGDTHKISYEELKAAVLPGHEKK